MSQASSPRLPERARILLIRFSSLGDVVKCTALPRLIHNAYPGAHLTMVTAAEFHDLIAGNPHLHRTIGFDRRGGWRAFNALRRELGAQPWDLVVDVHRSLRSRLLGWSLRGPRTRYSKRTLQRWLLLNFRVNTYHPATGKEQDFLAGLLPYGVRDDGRGTEINLEPVARDDGLRKRLGAQLKRIEAWRRAGRPVLGIAPVAAWELKTWPLSHFRELVAAFREKTGGAVVLFGGPGDGAVEEVIAGAGDAALSLVGRTGLLESAYFASLADVVVANDTGMSHLSEAVGTPVVALFGPTSRELGYFPVLPGSRVAELPLPCRPCTRTGQGVCRHPHRKACLEGIAPGAVLTQVVHLLQGRPGAGGTKPRRRGP